MTSELQPLMLAAQQIRRIAYEQRENAASSTHEETLDQLSLIEHLADVVVARTLKQMGCSNSLELYERAMPKQCLHCWGECDRCGP